jgi:tRNA-dihydrouridine synthase
MAMMFKSELNQALAAHRTGTRLSVAPMMDWSDRHCRYLHRLLSNHALLYTEMVTTGALLHGDVPRHLRFNAEANLLIWRSAPSWGKTGAMTKSTSTAAAPASGCSAALLVLA